MIPYLIVFAASAGVVLVATPLVRLLSLRLGWIDHPSDRKVHPKSTPTVGGLAIFAGVLAGLAVARAIPEFSTLAKGSSDAQAALLAGFVVVLVGALYDVRGLSVPAKVAGQILAAGLLILAGVQLVYFWFPGQGILSLSPDLQVALSVLWVVAMINAVNLIDGLDGLAAGMVAIAAIAFFIYMYMAPGQFGATSPAALLSAIVAGAAIGFLPWNFHPARIFMGDSGAMLLGLMLGVATIAGVGRNAYPPSGGDLAAFSIPVVVPLVVLAIPFLDVCLAIVRRLRSHRKVTAPDKEHLHHRLLEIGHTHRQAVLLMYLWSALISGSALAVALINGRPFVGGILGVALLLFLVTAVPRARGAGVTGRARRNGGGKHRAGGGNGNGRSDASALSGVAPDPGSPASPAVGQKGSPEA